MSARQDHASVARRRRGESRDAGVARTGPEKSWRIDLGLELLAMHAQPGVCYTRQQIAIFCGCTDAAIYAIERKALRKLREHGRGLAR